MAAEKLFKLSPIARPEDPNWDLLPNRGTVWVAARSSGEARAKAADWEESHIGQTGPDRIDPGYASAFADPGLYAVTQVEGNADKRDVIS